MKHWIIIVAMTCASLSGIGQTSIRGRILDGHQHLPSVTVVLYSPDTTLVKGSATDSLGHFRLDNVLPGKYFLAATMVGYVKFSSPELFIDDKPVTMHDIVLEESSTALGEIVIRSEKPLVEQKIDRLVVNIEGRATAAGNTVLEVLQKCPGVVVSKHNGTISMSGKSGVKIMINGKIMQMSIDVVLEMLEGMSASNVQKVELITTPPASLDAEGNAGIIHIITNENVEYGTHGSFGITAGWRWAEAPGGSVSLHHRGEDLAWSFDYSITRNHNLHIFKMARQYDRGGLQFVEDYSHRESRTNLQNLSVGTEWKPGDRATIHILLTAHRRAWRMNANAVETDNSSKDSTITTTMDVNELNLWQSATGSVGLTVASGLKSKVRFNIDYLFYHNNNPSDYNVQSIETAKIGLVKTTPIRMVVGSVDYQYYPSPEVTVETGVKVVRSALSNDVIVRRYIQNEWSTDPKFTSDAALSESVAAGYFQTTWKAGQRWQVNGGVRYEYTDTELGTASEKNMLRRKYGYFFPSLSIKKILRDEMDVQFSYARRISRPTYNDIAPYVFLWSTSAISSGNTSLYPSVADAITASFHFKQWFISLHSTRSRREIAMMQPYFDDESKTLTFSSQNLRHLNTIGLTNSYSAWMTHWWELQGTVTVQYQTSQTLHLQRNLSLNQLAINLNVLSVIKLPRDFTLEISGMYQSTSLSGASRFLEFASLNAAVQKKLGKNGVLTFSADDILETNNWRIKTMSAENNLDTFFDYHWNNRFIRLSYTFNFGNTKVGSLKVKSASEEERRRVN